MSKLGEHQEAIACYDKVLEINPRDAIAWHNKGVVLSNLGRHQDAVEAYENFIKFAPAHDAAQVAEVKAIIQKLKAKTGK